MKTRKSKARRRYGDIWLWSIAFLMVPAMVPAQTPTAKAEPSLLEEGGSSKFSTAKNGPYQIKIVSYNIRWRSGDELRRISQNLKSAAGIGGATVIGLQEVDRNKGRTGNVNTARILAQELGMYYAWAAPPATKGAKEEETGVAILSAYPLTETTHIVLPNEGPGGRRRSALGATVTIGSRKIRVYSVHAETRITVGKKLDQMRAVLADLNHYPKTMPAIVLGDFNTWEVNAGEETTRLFVDADFQTPLPSDAPTFQTKALITIELKLDWIWLRGLPAESYGIDRTLTVSDHWPLWTVVTLKGGSTQEQ
jgi:endonuclease/exonuclease/phosphatase family metal-dependent hydrolase